MNKLYYILFSLIFIAIAYTGLFYVSGKPYFVLSDDSMISLWYAKTLDLTCEGYSNPLWTALMIPCNLLPKNLASIPILLINLICILGIMKYSKRPLLVGLSFPLIFWGIRGSEFVAIAFLFFYGIKNKGYLASKFNIKNLDIIIAIILITFLRIDGFVYSGILLISNYKKWKY